MTLRRPLRPSPHHTHVSTVDSRVMRGLGVSHSYGVLSADSKFNNNMAAGTPNVSVTINLTAVRHGHVGASSVFDIWSQEVIGAVSAGTTTFDAPSSISSHDSLFYLFEPK